MKEKNQKENKIKHNVLNSQKNINEEKKKLIKREKRMMLKQELEKKLVEEYRLKQEAEAKKCKAEKEELEIIKKLKSTTQQHKNVIEEMNKMNLNSVISGNYNENEGDINSNSNK